MTAPDPIHASRDVRSIDIRLIATARTCWTASAAFSEGLPELISAYELVNDGFAHLTPAGKPIA